MSNLVMEQSFYFNDILILQLLLGSIIFIIGSIIIFITLYMNNITNFLYKIIIIILHFLCTYIFSILIWFFLPQNINIMLIECINIPALIAECVSLPLFILIIKYIKYINLKKCRKN